MQETPLKTRIKIIRCPYCRHESCKTLSSTLQSTVRSLRKSAFSVVGDNKIRRALNAAAKRFDDLQQKLSKIMSQVLLIRRPARVRRRRQV